MLEFEKKLWKKGYNLVAGVDEAGRGPLAGPVVAAAVVFPKNCKLIDRINDSKKLSHKSRLEMREIIYEQASSVAVSIIDEQKIDEINILQASLLAMKNAVENLADKPDALLIDGRHSPDWPGHMECIIKGDSKSMSIAAASIIAKTTRDAIMVEMAEKYPNYNFAKHKGYGTKKHIEAILEHGLCDIHRRSFKPHIIMEQRPELYE